MDLSWSTCSADSVNKSSIDVKPIPLNDEVDQEQTEQIDVAIAAAKLLAGAVGRPGDEVFVSISGHANPGHAPKEGWSNETVTVSVTAKPKEG